MRFITFAFMLSFVASAIGDEVHDYSSYSTVDEKAFESKVSSDVVAKTPTWSPEAENPPLSARRAIRVARKQMEALVHNPSVWRLDTIQLLDMGDHLHWMYIVEFERQYPPDFAVYGDHSLRILVLMNGVAITPRPKEVRR